LALGQDILIGWLAVDSDKPIIREEEFEEDFETSKNENSANAIADSKKDVGIIGENSMPQPELVKLEYPVGFNSLLLGNLSYSNSMQEIKKSEVANWDNTMPDNGTVYVLHKNAIIDSYVEMYNPNLKRSVRAKVIGRIPYGAYTNDVNLVLSPRTAKQLGALDKRFKVELKVLIFKTTSN
jgi:hypothetical protein